MLTDATNRAAARGIDSGISPAMQKAVHAAHVYDSVISAKVEDGEAINKAVEDLFACVREGSPELTLEAVFYQAGLIDDGIKGRITNRELAILQLELDDDRTPALVF